MKNCEKCIHHKVCASYLADIGLDSDNWEHDMSLCCEDFVDSSQFAPVVRCKDCAWYDEQSCCVNPHCTKSYYGCRMSQDNFCSYGERRCNDV